MKSWMFTALPFNTPAGLFKLRGGSDMLTGMQGDNGCGQRNSIPLNIAEGNGRVTEADRRHFFEIARGSALECAAVQDVIEVCGCMPAKENMEGKDMLDRLVAMLTRIGSRGYTVREDTTNLAESSE